MSSNQDQGPGIFLVDGHSTTQPQIVANMGVGPQRVNPQGSYPQESNPPGSYPQEFPQESYLKPTYPQGLLPGEAIPLPPPEYKPPDNNVSVDQGCGEDGQFKAFDFTEVTVRRAFVRKVYGILTCQLLVTIAIIALFLFHEPTRKWASQNLYMFVIAIVIYFVMVLTMICSGELRRKYPANLIFLGVFTLATGYMLGCVTSVYHADEVMIAVGVTAAVVFGPQTYIEIDGKSASNCIRNLRVEFFVKRVTCAFMPNRIMHILYASAGALIFSLYIVYDTQLMLGGEHKYSISPEEYIFAALNLYLDIINLFLRILYLLGRR